MAITRMRVRPTHLFIASTLCLCVVSTTHAGPIQSTLTFSTSGTIGSTGVGGEPAVSFHGVNGGTLVTGSPFNLGEFVVNPPPDGVTTTYNDTPFVLTLDIKSIDGSVVPNNESTVQLQGSLLGSITSNGASTLRAKFAGDGQPIQPEMSFTTGPLLNLLSIPNSVSIPASGGAVVTTGLPGRIDAFAVPEPGTMVIFLAGGAGALIYGNSLRRRS